MKLLALIAIVGSFFMIKYREQVGNLFGNPTWAEKVGGIYNVVIIVAILFFFWGLAELTGTTDFLLRPLQSLPGVQQSA